jgi:hypothetical protein
MWLRPIDAAMRERARNFERFFDRDVYVWAVTHSAPRDLFVTELPHANLNPASLAVMAAGRFSVALPATYSNPYVDWAPRNVRSLEYLAAAHAPSPQGAAVLCDLVAEAGPGAAAYVVLPHGEAVTASALRVASVGRSSTIYRVSPDGCQADAGLRAPDAGLRATDSDGTATCRAAGTARTACPR